LTRQCDGRGYSASSVAVGQSRLWSRGGTSRLNGRRSPSDGRDSRFRFDRRCIDLCISGIGHRCCDRNGRRGLTRCKNRILCFTLCCGDHRFSLTNALHCIPQAIATFDYLDLNREIGRDTHLGVIERFLCGFRYCNIFAFLARALSSASVLSSFRLRGRNGGGVRGEETRSVEFAMRPMCGSGTRHRGGAVASSSEL
jgi:hypothetical protein